MEGKLFGIDGNKNICYISAELSEDDAYDFCVNSKNHLPDGLTLLESGVAPEGFSIGPTVINKGQWYAKLGVEPDTLNQLKEGGLSMILKSDNSDYGKTNETFHKILKSSPVGTQATLLDILDKAQEQGTETITVPVYDSVLKDLDALSKAKFNFTEDRNGKKVTHEDNILNYKYEPDTNEAEIKLSSYLSML